MKDITHYIKESIKIIHQQVFDNVIPMTVSQWNDWKSSQQTQDIIVYEEPQKSNIYNIYLNTKPLTHIGLYDVKEQELHCNDKTIFSKE